MTHCSHGLSHVSPDIAREIGGVERVRLVATPVTIEQARCDTGKARAVWGVPDLSTRRCFLVTSGPLILSAQILLRYNNVLHVHLTFVTDIINVPILILTAGTSAAHMFSSTKTY